MDVWAQSAFDCRLEWGWRGATVACGAQRAARPGNLLVIVDVLAFSTTAATAAAQGAVLYPCQNESEVVSVCERTGAERGVHRRDVPGKGRFSLSPLSFLGVDSGTLVALSSPNGATCCRLASQSQSDDAPLWLGALVNARATATAIAAALRPGSTVTVLACGERWQTEDKSGDGPLRFAVEDLWGAGAILSFLPAHLTRSPEARAAEAAFRDVEEDLAANLLACGSGQELLQKGFAADVVHAARLNLYDTPVWFQNGQIIAAPRV